VAGAPRVHQVAAAGFGAQAPAYQRARPGYPAEAVAWLADRLAIGPGRRVADLAAGTGKLTELLIPYRARLVAVEPVAGMRAELSGRLPGLPVLGAVAEALPFVDGGLDAVTVAQAFHWFDPVPAMTQLARVLPPGGVLGLVWNARDRGVEWVDQVWAVMDRVERTAPWRDHRDGGSGPASRRWIEDDLVTLGPWTPFERAEFRHVHRVEPELVVDRIASVSHVAALPGPQQAAVLDQVRTILREHPDTRGARRLEVPYRADVMVTRRRGSAGTG
jgi:SAM-dependent methyltransferase